MPDYNSDDNAQSPTQTPKHPGGAPRQYNRRAIMLLIEEQMASGITLREVLKQDLMPQESKVYEWINEPELREIFLRAQEKWCLAQKSIMLEIADDQSRDLQPYKRTYVTKNGSEIIEEGVKSDNTCVNRDRLRVQARQWAMAKLAPKIFGDKVTNEHTGPNGQPIVVNVIAKLAPQNNSVIPQPIAPHSHTIELKNNNDVFSLAPAQADQPQALEVQPESEGRGPGPVLPIKMKLGNE